MENEKKWDEKIENKFYSLFSDKYFSSFEEYMENEKKWNEESISINSLKFLLNFFVQDFVTNFMLYNNHLTNYEIQVILGMTFFDAVKNSDQYFSKGNKKEN